MTEFSWQDGRKIWMKFDMSDNIKHPETPCRIWMKLWVMNKKDILRATDILLNFAWEITAFEYSSRDIKENSFEIWKPIMGYKSFKNKLYSFMYQIYGSNQDQRNKKKIVIKRTDKDTTSKFSSLPSLDLPIAALIIRSENLWIVMSSIQ